MTHEIMTMASAYRMTQWNCSGTLEKLEPHHFRSNEVLFFGSEETSKLIRIVSEQAELLRRIEGRQAAEGTHFFSFTSWV